MRGFPKSKHGFGAFSAVMLRFMSTPMPPLTCDGTEPTGEEQIEKNRL